MAETLYQRLGGADGITQLVDDAVDAHPLILMEAAINERLRRSGDVRLHPRLVNAPLIYEPRGRLALARIYGEYMDIAAQARLPLLLCTPTWRANHARVTASQLNRTINRDAAGFMQALRAARPADGPAVLVGGLLGCRNDCYRPDEALTADEAEQFHAWQVDELTQGGVDFLLAETLPSVQEALGIARALQSSGLPYIISFVIGRDGRVLDRTRLHEAFDLVDTGTETRPLGYMINCAYPTFLNADAQPEAVFRRLIAYQANASSLDHCDLDGATELAADSVSDWGEEMLRLNRNYNVKILGGCCGTSGEHLQYLVDHR